MTDIWDNDEVKGWLKRAKEDCLPKVKSCEIFASIVSGDPNPKIAVEFGFAMLLDKPIVVMVPKGLMDKVPQNLHRVAVAIREVDFDDPKAVETAWNELQAEAEKDGRIKHGN